MLFYVMTILQIREKNINQTIVFFFSKACQKIIHYNISLLYFYFKDLHQIIILFFSFLFLFLFQINNITEIKICYYGYKWDFCKMVFFLLEGFLLKGIFAISEVFAKFDFCKVGFLLSGTFAKLDFCYKWDIC